MTIRIRYENGEEALVRMVAHINYLNHKRKILDAEEMRVLANVTNKELYSPARDSAIAFGVDVSGLPKRLRANTRLPTLQMPGPGGTRQYKIK